VRDEIRASLACHLPGYEVRYVAELGEGLDDAVYAVNGELIGWDHKRGPDGAWHDWLQLDMLKEKLPS
jgi:hypothetical protein